MKFLLPKNWGIAKVYRDFKNFRDWIRIIKQEERDVNSKFNKWKLSRTKLYDVYVIVSLEEQDSELPDMIKRTKVMELLNPLNRYLDEELGFAECLTIEFNQFEDDDKNLTLTYLVVYRFKFEKFSLKWLLKFLVITGGLIFAIVYFDLIPLLITWVSSLI